MFEKNLGSVETKDSKMIRPNIRIVFERKKIQRMLELKGQKPLEALHSKLNSGQHWIILLSQNGY